MEKEETTALGFPEQQQLKVELDSPPLSSDDDDETEPDDSDGEEEEGGDGVGVGAGAGTLVSGGPPLKKGPWTPEEDKRLRTYVEAHGEGNWNQVQRNAGLNRCGKSCRLRWANHLRPHLKKGPFDEDEEQKIIEFHAMYGNKWAKMANQLPGRTDNEIKNFWNTRKKRREKTGLGLYPDGLLSRVQNQDRDSHSPDDSQGKKRPNELSHGNGLVFDDIVFEKLDYKKRAENFLAPTFRIQDSLPLKSMNPLKRHASSDMVSGYGVSPTCERFPQEPEKTCYTDIYSGMNHSVPFSNAIANGPPIFDGNFSTPGTIQRPVKIELPSFQNTGYESVNSMSDTLTSSPASVLMQTNYFSSQNTCLLDAIVQQGHLPGDPTKFQAAHDVSVSPVVYVCPLSSHSSIFDANLLESSPASLYPLPEDVKRQAEDLYADSYLSIMADINRQAGDIYAEDPCMHDASAEDPHDALAETRYLNEDSPHSEYEPINHSHNVMLYGDSCDDVMLSGAGNGHHGHQLGLESVPWNSMPGVHHMSESSNVSQQQL